MQAFYSVALIAKITMMFTVLLDYLIVVRMMKEQDTDAYKILLTLLIIFLNICSENYLN